jgi:hypothetical protein
MAKRKKLAKKSTPRRVASTANRNSTKKAARPTDGDVSESLLQTRHANAKRQVQPSQSIKRER